MTKRFRDRGRRPDLVIVDSKLGADVLPMIAAGAGGTAILFQDLEQLTAETVAAFGVAPAADRVARREPHTVPELHDPASGRLDAARVARFFGLSLSALAKALARRCTRHRTRRACRLRTLAPLARIATSLLTLLGTAEKARVWMNAPHPDLDRVAPLDLVKANKASVVADLLEDVLLGQTA